MKKKYIRPDSRLFAINLSENIADSQTGSSGETGVTGGLGVDYTKYSNGTGYFNTPQYPFDTNSSGSVDQALADMQRADFDTFYAMLFECLHRWN